MYTVDILSKAPLPIHEDILDQEEMLNETTFLTITKEMPFSNERLKNIKKAQQDHSICKKTTLLYNEMDGVTMKTVKKS